MANYDFIGGQGLSPADMRGAQAGVQGEARYINRDFRAEERLRRRQQLIQSLGLLAALGGNAYYNRGQRPGPVPRDRLGNAAYTTGAPGTGNAGLESGLADLLVLQRQRNRGLVPPRSPAYQMAPLPPEEY